MHFHTNRIVMKPISIEEAIKKGKETPKARPLDELLTDLAKTNAVVKTAAAAPAVVTAATTPAPVEAPKAEAPKIETPKVEAKTTVEVKIAEEKKDDDIEVVEVEDKDKKKEEKKDDKEACMASNKNVALKIAKKLDFRGWSAEDVVKAWGQHGSMPQCVKNVGSEANDAKTYCALLQVASSEASKVIKTAAAEKPAKTASKNLFVKISKLDETDKALLSKYFSRIYGKAYVDALLGDY